jgi:membrane protease YdiL (CAAX protease family)
MTRLLLTIGIQFAAVGPLIFFTLRRSDQQWKCLALFAGYYLFYVCMLTLPNWCPETKIVHSATWNWSGKIFAIVGSILYYFQCRPAMVGHDYITLRQRETSLKPKLKAVILLFLATIALSFWAIQHSAERTEQLLFQFTMPGIDEEIAFRGIMLGLLSNALHPQVKFGRLNLGNPASWVTSILFALGHSFVIDKDWNFDQNWFEFVNTLAMGLWLGWMTRKSGSILMSTLSHNLVNTLPKILFWI